MLTRATGHTSNEAGAHRGLVEAEHSAVESTAHVALRCSWVMQETDLQGDGTLFP